jgi:hypothetical protein
MERDKRIELSPPPWQGGVLPLYESRVPQNYPQIFITCRPPALKCARACFAQEADARKADAPLRQNEKRPNFAAKLAARLIDFHDTRRFHDRRLLLAFGKPFGPLAIDVHAPELFAVMVVHGDLPMAVLAPAVALKPA